MLTPSFSYVWQKTRFAFFALFPRIGNWNSGTNVRRASSKALICGIVKFYNLTPCVNLLHHPIIRLGIEFTSQIIFFKRSFEGYIGQQTQSSCFSLSSCMKHVLDVDTASLTQCDNVIQCDTICNNVTLWHNVKLMIFTQILPMGWFQRSSILLNSKSGEKLVKMIRITNHSLNKAQTECLEMWLCSFGL